MARTRGVGERDSVELIYQAWRAFRRMTFGLGTRVRLYQAIPDVLARYNDASAELARRDAAEGRPPAGAAIEAWFLGELWDFLRLADRAIERRNNSMFLDRPPVPPQAPRPA
jgi:hypothetical protein